MTLEGQAAKVHAALLRCNIPDYMHEGIADYVLRGMRPGGFLYALFSNDFMHMVATADIQNRECLLSYAQLLYDLPCACWGSENDVEDWIKRGGITGTFAIREAARLAAQSKAAE